ncbi:unnamed protein product, partial [Iphiclides podalirius]
MSHVSNTLQRSMATEQDVLFGPNKTVESVVTTPLRHKAAHALRSGDAMNRPRRPAPAQAGVQFHSSPARTPGHTRKAMTRRALRPPAQLRTRGADILY